MSIRRPGASRRWVRRPYVSVYAEADESLRHASWLELFFDLVFIVVVAAMGHHLREHLDLGGLFEFVVLFTIVWWIWLSYSYYADTYHTDSPLPSAMLIVVMFGVLLLAETVDDALVGGSLAFGIAVFALRALNTGLHLLVRRLESEAKPFLDYWLLLEVGVTTVWGLSLFVPEPGRYGLWIASFLLSTAGITVVYLAFDRIEAQVSHFNERLGLFTILVLGETILAVAAETSVETWGVRAILAGAVGFSIAVAVWWLYFHPFDEEVINRVLRADGDDWRSARQRGIAHIYGHYPIHAGIVLAGVGIGAVAGTSLSGETLTLGARIALVGGLGAFLVGSGFCHWVAPAGTETRDLVGRIAAAAAVVVGGGLVVDNQPLTLLTVVAVVVVGLCVVEWRWDSDRSVRATLAAATSADGGADDEQGVRS